MAAVRAAAHAAKAARAVQIAPRGRRHGAWRVLAEAERKAKAAKADAKKRVDQMTRAAVAAAALRDQRVVHQREVRACSVAQLVATGAARAAKMAAKSKKDRKVGL